MLLGCCSLAERSVRRSRGRHESRSRAPRRASRIMIGALVVGGRAFPDEREGDKLAEALGADKHRLPYHSHPAPPQPAHQLVTTDAVRRVDGE